MEAGPLQLMLNSLWPIFVAGLERTVPLAVVTFILGMALAVLTALARLSKLGWLRGIAWFYVWVFRGTPLLVQLFIIFYGLPYLGLTLGNWTSAIIGFTLNVGAYASETIRASILSVPKGQWEAAYSLGMNGGQALRRIIIPQATRVSVPPLANEFIGLVKDTSLAAVITVPELFQKAQDIVGSTFKPFPVYVDAAIVYLAFCTVLAWLQHKLERRLSRYVVS
ncbi:amino acid ABC transporter permease [Alicyclobacillus fastidiosus]|uniref:Amino acid ABC transporter permease n=1 Tax=Alicyclobacillus fastidiosus TaxID=392011 RepID=A0ABV5ACJ9_9BACL|nr:amino acid ABC transporter permease [Alicyclobacillus fastidiosus]WEH11383.1 amino acid ABC transporter permease [Alicyclobacillus fastidiosus]